MKADIRTQIDRHPIVVIISVCVAVLAVAVPVLEWVHALRRERAASGYETTISELKIKLAGLEYEMKQAREERDRSKISPPTQDSKPSNQSPPITNQDLDNHSSAAKPVASDPGPPDARPPPPPPAPTKSIYDRESMETQTLGDLHFELKGCLRKSPNIECYFLVTNQGPVRQIPVCAQYCGTLLIDQQGRENLASHVRIANKEDRSYVVFNFRTDIPVRATFVFGGISASAQQIEILELHFGISGTTVISFSEAVIHES